MKTEHPDVPWIDPNHVANRATIPQNVLDQYAGQHVAYSWDGTRIVAGAPELDELHEKLKAMGADLGLVVFSYLDIGDTSWLCGDLEQVELTVNGASPGT